MFYLIFCNNCQIRKIFSISELKEKVKYNSAPLKKIIDGKDEFIKFPIIKCENCGYLCKISKIEEEKKLDKEEELKII